MKRIMIDLDDTITTNDWLKHLNNFMNTNYVEADIDGYYFEYLIPEERRAEYFDYVFDNGAYEDSVPYDNAREVIEELTKHYEVFIVSSYELKPYPEKAARQLEQKYLWIRKHLPFINDRHIIFASEKKIIDVDIRIDDKVSNMVGSGSIKLLYTAYHNKDNAPVAELNEKGITRVNNWLEIKNILLNSELE